MWDFSLSGKFLHCLFIFNVMDVYDLFSYEKFFHIKAEIPFSNTSLIAVSSD